jgi:hypothetical protein
MTSYRQAAAVAVLITATAAGCHSSSGAAKASAAATSTVVQQGKADAEQYFGKCIPASAAAQVKLVASLGSKSGRAALMQCAGVPKDDRQAAEACWLGNIEHGGTLPEGASAKMSALLNDGYPCAVKYRAGGTASPSASAS